MLGSFASRFCGSADIYTKPGKGPAGSINFITCHDGFTLADLVSYAAKHNQANGENDQDGSNNNFSSNYGFEGSTPDAGIEAFRKRQIKNFLLTLFISRGIPMILGGDEIRRTQGGNNNAYCQDNETSWMDWSRLDQHQEIFRFTQGMIAFRAAHPVLSKEKFYENEDIHWFGPQGGTPHWVDPRCQQVACLIPENDQESLFLIFNAGKQAVDFALPSLGEEHRWSLFVDTFLPSPNDMAVPGKETPLKYPKSYLVESRSSVILRATKTKQGA